MNLKKSVIISLSSLFLVFASPIANAENQPITSFEQYLNSLPKVMKKAYLGFQHDADVIRLQDLKYWVSLIEEYQQKIGKYPFQYSSNKPIIVKVATPMQQADSKGYPPPPVITRSMKEFVQTLEKGLGRKIDEYYDPQYKADVKPNFYIYMVDNNSYYFAIHTNQSYPFSRAVLPPYYNKIEVSNISQGGKYLIVTPKSLFNDKVYQDKSNSKHIEKAKFFQKRRDKTLHATKDK